MKTLYRVLVMLACTTGLSLAQTNMGHPPTTPPTFPTQQQPGAQQKPDESGALGQAGANSASAANKAQSDIKAALQSQLSGVADNVTVSVTDDNKIELNGAVSSSPEKAQVEQVAHSVAPNQIIVNKLNVNKSPNGPGSQPSGSKPPVFQ